MKKSGTLLLVILCFVGFCSITSTAKASTDQPMEWSETTNINDSTITSAMTSNTKAAYVSDHSGNLYTAWAERSGTYSIIRAKKYNGSTWDTIDGGEGLNISSSMNAVDPSLVIYQGSLYIAWLEQCTTGDGSRYAIYVKRYDGQTTWTRVDDGGTGGICYDEFPDADSISMEVHGDNLYTVWEEGYVGIKNYKIHVKQYNSNTNTWKFVDGDTLTGINQIPGHEAFNPSLFSYDGLLYATWYEQDTSLIGQVIVKRCDVDNTDSTYNWISVSGNTETGLNNNSTKAGYNSKLFAMNDTLYAVWQENLQLWIRSYDKSSDSWSAPTSLAGTMVSHYNIAVYNNSLYLVYIKGASTYKTCVLKYDGMNITNLLNGTETSLNTDTNYYKNPPAIAVHNNLLFVSWVDQAASGVYSYNIKNKAMTLPHIVTTPKNLSEDTLDTASLSLLLYGTSFKDTTYDTKNFTLTNAPAGLSIESVTDNSGVCTVNLAYSGIRDFDSDINHLGISVAGAEITSGDELSDTLSIAANDDMESISITDDGNLWEGAENGEVITVTLIGGTFEDTITPANWTVANLPDGVTLGSVERVDAHRVNIKLSGNSTKDYDTDITNVSVSCSTSEYADSTGGGPLAADTGVTIRAHVKTLESIAITTPASKLIYAVGDALDISGLEVTGTYSDGSTKIVNLTTADISGFDSSAPATDQVLTITVDGKTTTFTVSILDNSTGEATLESLAITTPASKLLYAIGENLDLSGLVVTGTYSDGSTKIVNLTTADISGFDSSVPATDQVLTITVDGKTATYTVSILDNSTGEATLESLAITTPASKLLYAVGDSLDLSGLVVTGTYSDGSTKIVNLTAANISGFDSSVPASDQVLTITVDGKTATYTVSFFDNNTGEATLESIAIMTPASKLIYTVGDSLDISGLVVIGTYSNGNNKIETVTGGAISGFDSSAPAVNQVLTVTVGGKTTTYTITIRAISNDNGSHSGNNGGGGSSSNVETSNYVSESGGVLFKISHSPDNEILNLDITLTPAYENEEKELTIPLTTPDILNEIETSNAHQVTITVTLPSSRLSGEEVKQIHIDLAPELFEAAKKAGKNITVSVHDETGKERYSWTFTKDNLTNSKQELGKVNLYLQVTSVNSTESLKKRLEDNGTKTQNGIVISFSHDGILPSQAGVKLYVGNTLMAGSIVYLYHYDPETGKLMSVPFNSSSVDKDGYITIDIVHCSNYVLLEEPAAKGVITPLKNQISITEPKAFLYADGSRDKTSAIHVKLPATLELVTDLSDKTSESAIGGVTITHRSDNNKVAKVDKNGIITAVGVGKVTIYTTVKLYNGESKTFKNSVTVKEAYIQFTKSTSKMSVGDTFTFKVKAYGLDEKDIKWATTKKSIITVNKKTGEVKAVSSGTDYVVVTLLDKEKKLKVVVK
ncbi:bacterial Ig-like domain-containing protein [Anaerocolumna sp. AGMB13025]|uniref:bacterial Ig-like domain-containing protein n=1 Tax=Anaerocolumna sp. AGMB13025 TaxID=3039116 RepID=UPI00241C2EBC|nr:bacterial Ig-like domain-containing protein [Anaerocolumna sp. AGMB13025]WFR57579.1 bacterial Ig-like domain-containing protein [Anaerocolumna sp. AGMB13025]